MKPNLFEAALAVDSALNGLDSATIDFESRAYTLTNDQIDAIKRDLYHAANIINKTIAKDITSTIKCGAV